MLLGIKVEFVIFVGTCVYRRSSQFCQSKQSSVKTLNFFLQSGILYKTHSLWQKYVISVHKMCSQCEYKYPCLVAIYFAIIIKNVILLANGPFLTLNLNNLIYIGHYKFDVQWKSLWLSGNKVTYLTQMKPYFIFAISLSQVQKDNIGRGGERKRNCRMVHYIALAMQ